MLYSTKSIFEDRPLGISMGSFSQYNNSRSIFGDRPLGISVGSFSPQCYIALRVFLGTDHLELVWDHFHSSVIIVLRVFWGTDHLELVWDHFHSSVIICLLYTSPSPRDGLLSRMPSSA